MRFEKFVPVAFAPRLKEPLCGVSVSVRRAGEEGKTHVEPGVRCALRVDERGFDFEDDARLCQEQRRQHLCGCMMMTKKFETYCFLRCRPDAS